MTTDEQLMLDLQGGSREAFEELFARYRGPLWGFFRRRVAEAGRAEEMAHDTFVAILQSANRYAPRGTFRAYVFGIAYNVLLADRRRAAHRTSEAIKHEPPAPHVDPDIMLWVRGALDQLDAADREILMLREYEQLSYEEIAQVQGLPINTVRSRLFRARMGLKAVLESRARVKVTS